MPFSQEYLELEQREAYNAYQEELALQKELNILRNDFYYQLIDSKVTSLVDFLYKPLDILSGDAYSARRIDENRTFYLLVDGMGKGLSAAFTAVTMTTFVNHLVDKMIEHHSFSLDMLVQESMAYIQPILLDEESVAIDYIYFDSYFGELQYAKFATPPFLLHDRDDNIIKLKSNNIPLNKWQEGYKIDTFDVKNVDKFLFYSDGIVENMTKDEGVLYAEFLEEDFRNSFTREELKEKFFGRIEQQEDDVTLIFINSLDLKKETLIESRTFDSTLEAVDSANEWYEAVWRAKINVDAKTIYKAGIVFNELFMNAYEHGNLGLDMVTKHRYLEEDIYFEELSKLERECRKKISVSLFALEEQNSHYVVTKIVDEGDGFNTLKLSTIFRNSLQFNGRGVFVSRKNSMGIYYNAKGNSVLFLHKV